jgi:hypothetical protein
VHLLRYLDSLIVVITNRCLPPASGLDTEKQELRYLKDRVPQTPPTPRQLGTPQETVDNEGFTALRPRERPRQRIAYDFDMCNVLQRLMDHNPRAREQ